MPFFNTVKNFVNSSTEIKVREITDDTENSISHGNGGTIMNEISVLTYSPKTLKEIISVLRKRLSIALYLTKRFSHKNCVIVVKTLTLISYLLNNGSNEFITWLKTTSNHIFDHLNTVEIDENQINKKDLNIWLQIKHLANSILMLLNDSDLLEKRRQNVIEFRSSISSPGRKSTDNSHLTRYSSERLSNGCGRENNSYSGYNSMNINGSKSLDVNRRHQDTVMYTIADEGEEEAEEEEDTENDRFINFRLNRHRDVTLHGSNLAPESSTYPQQQGPISSNTNGNSRTTGIATRMFHASNPFNN